MKRHIYLFLGAALLLNVNKTFAQSQSPTPPARVAGKFEMAGATGNAVKINFSLSRSVVTNALHVFVSTTPDAMLFSIDVLDPGNKILMHWAPESASNTTSHTFDVSALQAGSYHVNINNDKAAIVKSISFSK